MKTTHLIIEHRYKNKLVGQHRYEPRQGRELVIGSSKESDIRLLGQDVNGVHAVIECDQEHWSISDLGSESGTWLEQEPIINRKLQPVTEIRIGGHQLKATLREAKTELFKKETGAEDQIQFKGDHRKDRRHQVIVKYKGAVVETHLLAAQEAFQFTMGEEKRSFAAPQSTTWETFQAGDYEIRQRIVEGVRLKNTLGQMIQAWRDPDMRLATTVATVSIFLFALLALLIPKGPDANLKEMMPENTVYSRVIYDSNLAKKRRAQAQADAAKRTPQVNNNAGAASSQPKNMASQKVISKIRTSGLSQLIGKISKRANVNSKYLVQAQGVTPDNVYSGRALASATASTLKAGALGGGGAQGSYRLAGIGTAGKGGGSGAYKSGTGLSEGQVGQANVGIADDETEVVGGLDKEEIAKIIKSQLGEIRYCYERQLSANPELYGKVLVKFSIGGEGKVVEQKIGSSTLGNAMVEGCILRRVAGWKFPRPNGGTTVIVSYPFLLKNTN